MVHINWKSPRKYLWVVNAIVFRFDRIFTKRDNTVWVFGAWEGRKYDDNTRFLFEYINKQHKEIRAVWLTKTENVKEEIRSRGYEAYCWNEKEAKAIQKKARVGVYTHGLVDFGTLPRVGGATIVSLWHGVGFKKIYNDKYHGWQLWLKRRMDWIFSWTYRDITTVTSQYIKQQFTSIFGLTEKDCVCITGQPRNDVFRIGLQKSKVLEKVGIDTDKKVILYMPTYRGAAMGENAMTHIVTELYESDELSDVLDRTNSILLVKTHPLTPRILLPNRKNFMVLDYYMIENNQELLAVSDVLVSDYSSCVVDFALLERPVIFFLPDHDEFIKRSEPLYEEFLTVCKNGACTNARQLAERIAKPDRDVVNAINALYEDQSIKGTCYTENVYNAIVKQL